MRSHPNTAQQFVSAVHRRLILFRMLEQFGRGFLVASIAAAELIGIAIWQAMPREPILLFCGVLGLLIGVVLAVIRWPTRLTAADEADHQLRFDDLLTTVLFATQAADDEFAKAVVAMADARCMAHSPSEVVLRQFGIRSWTGIALAMTIAATLAAIPMVPSHLQAKDSNLSVLSIDLTGTSAEQSLQQQYGSVSPMNDPTSESGSSNFQTSNQITKAANASSGKSESGNSTGTNGGSSRTNAASQQKIQAATSLSHAENSHGTTAGGGDGLAKTGAHGEAGLGIRNASQTSNPIPAWSGGGQSDSQIACPLRIDQVPAQDRDLVRDFFSGR